MTWLKGKVASVTFPLAERKPGVKEGSVSKFEPAEDEKEDKQEKLAATEGVHLSTPMQPVKPVTSEEALDQSAELVRAAFARTISILRASEKDIQDLGLDRTQLASTILGTIAIRAEKRLTVDAMTRRG